jgi:hypothetical protein
MIAARVDESSREAAPRFSAAPGADATTRVLCSIKARNETIKKCHERIVTKEWERNVKTTFLLSELNDSRARPA